MKNIDDMHQLNSPDYLLDKYKLKYTTNDEQMKKL